MKLHIFLLSMVLAFINLAHAQIDEEASDGTKPVKIVRNSSEFNRMDKSFSALFMPIGYGPNATLSNGILLDLNLDRNSLLEFEYIKGIDLNFHFYSTINTSVVANSFGLHYKQFIRNSLYLRGGADYRSVDYEYTSRDFLNNSILSRRSFKGNSVTATFLIGNQWQMKNFTIGCDWIGVSLPVTTQIESESFSGPEAKRSYLDDDQDRYIKKSTTILTRFYLGASF
jgi:hypothetical protein